MDADASDGPARRRPTARLRLPRHRHRHDAAAGPDTRACWAASGAGASSTSTPSRGPRRWPTALQHFDHGRLVVHITEMPIKCPVAPLEFTFLAEAWLRERGRPRPGRARLRDTARRRLHQAGRLAAPRRHARRAQDPRSSPTSWSSASTPSAKVLVSYDEREVPFDLLVTVPLNMGADFVARSGLGDELNYVPVDKHTLLSTAHDNIFAVGDASDIPASKAGSVAHFAVEVLRRQLPPAHRRAADDRLVRRPRQLLRRVRRRQGAADRLQLRHRAASGEVPAARASGR